MVEVVQMEATSASIASWMGKRKTLTISAKVNTYYQGLHHNERQRFTH